MTNPTTNTFIATASIEAMKPLWAAHKDGQIQLDSDFDNLDLWKRVASKILEYAPGVAFVGIAATGVIWTARHFSLISFPNWALFLIPIVCSIVQGVALRLHEIVSEIPDFRTAFSKTLTGLEKGVFIKVNFSYAEGFHSPANEMYNVAYCLEHDKDKENVDTASHYMRLLNQMPKAQSIPALKTGVVVLTLLSAIQRIQLHKKITLDIQEKLAFVGNNLAECSLPPECKARVAAVAKYLEKNPYLFKDEEKDIGKDYKPSLADLDTIYAAQAAEAAAQAAALGGSATQEETTSSGVTKARGQSI